MDHKKDCLFWCSHFLPLSRGRSAPFVEVLSKTKGLEILHFYEERSACFFALGRVRRDNRPAAVITTSGTAVAELLPGLIESHYSGLPLVLITADRPFPYSPKGCPQTLKKPLDIFKTYTAHSLNVSKKKDWNLKGWKPYKGSLHLNVAFDEPLLDQVSPTFHFSKEKFKKPPLIYPPLQSKAPSSDFKKFFQSCKKPLILVGELRKEETKPVYDVLKNYKGLLYTEPLSQLHFLSNQLLSGENILFDALKKKEIDAVIRLGGIPRNSFWRHLEKNNLSVLNLSSPPFYSGLSRKSLNEPLMEALSNLKKQIHSLEETWDSFKKYDRDQALKWKTILRKHPSSEVSWLKKIGESLPKKSKIFLGNSLPVRLWDMLKFSARNCSVTGQAGVNGIDGLVSRFFGECSSSHHNVAFIGDLSTLYDMTGFWKAKEIPSWNFVVINNFGGQIFSRLYKNPDFLNKHDLSFAPLAELWGLNYHLYKDISRYSWPKKKNPSLMEIRPDNQETEKCFSDYVSIWDTLNLD